jgi:hypothetical protein
MREKHQMKQQLFQAIAIGLGFCYTTEFAASGEAPVCERHTTRIPRIPSIPINAHIYFSRRSSLPCWKHQRRQAKFAGPLIYSSAHVRLRCELSKEIVTIVWLETKAGFHTSRM